MGFAKVTNICFTDSKSKHVHSVPRNLCYVL